MGGASYKCPYCERWSLSRHALRAHLKDRHNLRVDEIHGSGPLIELTGERPQNPTLPVTRGPGDVSELNLQGD